MSEESRLGREPIETAYALKQLIQAGVRVCLLPRGSGATFDSPTDKLLMSVTAVRRRTGTREGAAADLRRHGRARPGRDTSPAAACSATTTSRSASPTAGARTWNGGSTSRKPRSCGASSSCAPPAPAMRRIAKLLNADGAPNPGRSRDGRPAGRHPSVLKSCDGLSTAGRSSGIGPASAISGGARTRRSRPEVSGSRSRHRSCELFQRICGPRRTARFARIKARLVCGDRRAARGPHAGRDRSRTYSPASHAAHCAVVPCYPLSRSHGRKRAFFYGCRRTPQTRPGGLPEWSRDARRNASRRPCSAARR